MAYCPETAPQRCEYGVLDPNTHSPERYHTQYSTGPRAAQSKHCALRQPSAAPSSKPRQPRVDPSHYGLREPFATAPSSKKWRPPNVDTRKSQIGTRTHCDQAEETTPCHLHSGAYAPP